MSTLASIQAANLEDATLFDNLPRGALVVDRAGFVVMANRIARETFHSLIGREPNAPEPLTNLLSDPRPLLLEDIRAAASGGEMGLRVTPDDPPLVLRVSAMKPFGLYILSFASASFNRLRAELQQANMVAARERRLRQEAEISYQAMENFSTIAAHDLKQPLRNIAHLLSFLVEDYGEKLPSDAVELVETAKTSAGRLQNLIGDLLRHARVGSEPLKTQAIDIDEVVDGIEEDFAPALKDSGGRIVREGPLGQVTAAPALFRMVLENLIGNSLKYREPSRPPVVTLRRSGDGDVFEIEDNGRGFEPADAQRLFEPFTRLVSDPSIEGTGIGLASCRTVVLRHGWSIRAKGRPGVGATFRIQGLA